MRRLATLCVKEVKEKRTTDPHQLPIYATSSFNLESVEAGMHIFKDPSKGHLYGRFGNPTTDTVAQKIANIEAFDTKVTKVWGIMTSSGMSAISTLLLSELKSGDQLLTQGNIYGGTTELIHKTMANSGIEPILINLTDLNLVEETLQANPRIKLLYFETPSNPALDCIDLENISKVAKKFDVITVADNTFCTPVIQQPLKYGIDYVIHSTTKYLNGHGNSISGIIIGHQEENYQKTWSTMKLLGTNCSPWDAWLVNNGVKTLALRMEKHAKNAKSLAEYLTNHESVESVNYLGLPDHQHYQLAARQMNSFGGMLCFIVKGGLQKGINFMNRSCIGSLAPTMGDVDTLLMHPASMSHLNVPQKIREENGISDGLIRVSVGIEDIEDLKEDFDHALKRG